VTPSAGEYGDGASAIFSFPTLEASHDVLEDESEESLSNKVFSTPVDLVGVAGSLDDPYELQYRALVSEPGRSRA